MKKDIIKIQITAKLKLILFEQLGYLHIHGINRLTGDLEINVTVADKRKALIIYNGLGELAVCYSERQTAVEPRIDIYV